MRTQAKGKKTPEELEMSSEAEKDQEKKVKRSSSRVQKKREEPRDSTRWLPILFLILFLFISYLFWVR